MIAIKELKKRMEKSLLCVGLDPDKNKIPPGLAPAFFLQQVINITSNFVCAYKLQKAFFDLLPGEGTLKNTISYIHTKGIPAIIDCKIGDIENTMEAYMTNIFGKLEADGVVVNPYMGNEVMDFAKRYPTKIFVVLIRTSNEGAKIVQDVPIIDGRPLWQYMLDLAVNKWDGSHNIVPVISSTAGLNMKAVRKLIPQDMPILLAGVGAQGGSFKGLHDLLNDERTNVFVNSSRGVLYPDRNELLESGFWETAIQSSALELRNKLEVERNHE